MLLKIVKMLFKIVKMLVQMLGKCSKMHQDALDYCLRCSRFSVDSRRCSKMLLTIARDARNARQMLKDAQRCPWRLLEMLGILGKCSKMLEYFPSLGPRCSRCSASAPRCSKMLQDARRCSKMLLDAPRCPGPNADAPGGL